MLAVTTLLTILALSLLVIRIATVALTLTGLPQETARFQARSAFTGTGFTTSEAEGVVTHPVRRRIVLLLMLLGNAGLVTGVATLLLSFTGAGSAGSGLRRAGILLLGLVVLAVVARSRFADRALSRVIERVLRRWSRVAAQDYATLLPLGHHWIVAELQVNAEDWTAERTLAELDLPHEGVLVLGIQRADGRYVGAPTGSARVHAGDVLIAYAQRRSIEDLDRRPAGEAGDRQRQAAAATYRSELDTQQLGEARAERGDA